jgi:hypothetical protein
MYSPVQPYRLSGETRYLLYTSAEEDRFVADPQVGIISFSNLRELRYFADLHGIATNLQTAEDVDLDAAIDWLSVPTPDIEPDLLSSVWNFLHEVAVSADERGGALLALHAHHLRIYQKTFWALNLPVVTPAGGHYEPDWSREELTAIAAFLTDGIDLFLSTVFTFVPVS